MSFDDDALDFEVDLTDLETFGESTSVKTPKLRKDAALASITGCPSGPSKRPDRRIDDTGGSSQEEPASDQPDAKQRSMDCDSASDDVPECGGDSDDEKLVIDDSVSPTARPTAEPPPVVEPELSSLPQAAKRLCCRSRRTKAAADQLTEILRMQSAMFSSAHETPKCSIVAGAADPSAAPAARSQQTSLVKPCVSSYLERHKAEDSSGVSGSSIAAANTAAAEGRSECRIVSLSLGCTCH